MPIRDYTIITDSTTDLTPELIERMGVDVIPMELVMSDGTTYKNYPDGREIGFQAFYDKLRAGETAKTNQINVSTYCEAIERHVREGRDVLLLSFSSALSGTYQTSTIAVNDMREKYPDAKIVTVDTKSASMGEGLLVYFAAQQKAAGMSLDEVAKWVEDHRLHLCHWFTVDDLNHLKRGGRLSSAAALFGTLLGIKPVMHVDDAGCLIPVSKVRGRKQSLDALVQHMADTILPGQKTVFISHGDCPDDAQYLAQRVREQVDVEVLTGYIGPVIGAHSGPGTIAVFFLGSAR